MNLEGMIQYEAKNSEGKGSDLEEHLFMYGLVRLAKPQRVLELGVSRGHMTVWLAKAVKDNNNAGQLVSVDNWSAAHGGRATGPQRALKRCTDCRVESFVQFCKSDSVKYLEGCQPGDFDLIWVDADHSYEAAKVDVLQAMRIAPVVAVHDTDNQFRTVRQACQDIGGGTFLDFVRGIWIHTRAGSE